MRSPARFRSRKWRRFSSCSRLPNLTCCSATRGFTTTTSRRIRVPTFPCASRLNAIAGALPISEMEKIFQLFPAAELDLLQCDTRLYDDHIKTYSRADFPLRFPSECDRRRASDLGNGEDFPVVPGCRT